MFLVSLFDALRQDAERFKASVDTLTDGFYKEVAGFDIFNQEIKKARTEEAKGELLKLIDHQATHFSNISNAKISRVRAYIINAVMSPNTERLSTFKALVESAGGLISDDEKKLLVTSSSGDYWTLKYLANVENKQTDTTTASGILSLSIPSPDLKAYMDILEDAKAGQSGFYNNYRGDGVGGNKEQIDQILFLNGLPHAHWSEAFNGICPYFVDDMRCMRNTFDPSDRAQIEKIVGSSLAYGRDSVKQKIDSAIKENPALEDVFWRSEFADIVQELKTAEEVKSQKKLLDNTLAKGIKEAGEKSVEILAAQDN